MQRQLLTEGGSTYGPPTHYALLGVPPDASVEAIKQAYRTQVFRHHPDRNQGNPNSTEMMARINEAYQTLSDVEKRKVYNTRLGIGVAAPVAIPNRAPQQNIWTPPGNQQPITIFSKPALSHSMYVKPPSQKDRQIMYAKGYTPCYNCAGVGVVRPGYEVGTYCKPCSGTGYIPRVK
jgi:DnaJ-class molecular chaperone